MLVEEVVGNRGHDEVPGVAAGVHSLHDKGVDIPLVACAVQAAADTVASLWTPCSQAKPVMQWTSTRASGKLAGDHHSAMIRTQHQYMHKTSSKRCPQLANVSQQSIYFQCTAFKHAACDFALLTHVHAALTFSQNDQHVPSVMSLQRCTDLGGSLKPLPNDLPVGESLPLGDPRPGTGENRPPALMGGAP